MHKDVCYTSTSPLAAYFLAPLPGTKEEYFQRLKKTSRVNWAPSNSSSYSEQCDAAVTCNAEERLSGSTMAEG
jgi:hypothetical protein